MSLKLVRIFGFPIFFGLLSGTPAAQNCIPTNINGSTINLACSQSCTDLNFQIPHLKSTTDYTLVSVPYNPYQYLDPSGQESLGIYNDDQYGDKATIPFPFCFYDSVFYKFVVGSNGLITFDTTNANCANAYVIPAGLGIPNTGGGGQCIQTTSYYPRAAIMAAFSDLDPSLGASPPDRKVMWFIVGNAPCRKFVISFYHIGVFGAPCPTPANTFQIVIHESTGIIELFFQQKACFSSTNSGRGIFGIQDWTRTKAVWLPGRNPGNWSENNTGYQFIPSAGASRFVMSELFTLGGSFVSTADTNTTSPGLLNLNFQNVCPPPGNSVYVVKTTFSACHNTSIQLVSYDTVYINRNGVLNATATTTATSCTGVNNGTITITPSGGTAPFTYILDGGTPQSGGSPFTFTNVSPGPHTVVVSDASCTSNPINVNVVSGPPFSTTVNKTDALCNGGSTGTIIVTQPATGTPPYEYSLDGVNWQTSNTFTGLAAGTYTVYYRESNGCQGSQQVTINEPSAISASISATPVACNGQSNGVITVTASGGTAPFQYSLNGGPYQSGNTFNVPAGNYTVTIRDNNNCTTAQSINVTEPAVMTVSANTTNASCDGGNDGTITITASGGNSNYQYSIDGTNFQSSNIFNVTPGNYTVAVKDDKGCTSTQNVTVGLTSNLTMTPLTDKTICEGTSTQLQLTSNATQYAWSPAAGLSSTSISDPVANPVITTQYIVTATLGNCSLNDTVIVNVNTAPIPDAGPDGYICYGQSYQLQGSGGVSFSWTPSNYLNSSTDQNAVTTPAITITYSLSVIDANGCESLVTDDVTIDVTPPIIVSTFPKDTIVYAGDQFQILATSVANMYSWSPSMGLSNPSVPDPIVTAGSIGDIVLYKVTASTIAGCKGEGYVTVKVYKGPDIYMPTGFTPNNDGKNDKFKPFPVGIKQINYFKVFNRWGQLLFSTTTLNDGWDGKYAGVEQSSGVYVWMVQGVTEDDKVITKKGTVTLIR